MPSEARDKTHLLWNMVTEFINEFNNLMSGKQDSKQQAQTKEIKGGAKIREFFEKLYDELVYNFQATRYYTDGDIERAIQLHEGDQLAGFQSIDVFHYLIRPKLNLLTDPALDCLSDVHLYIEQLADEIAEMKFMRFPNTKNDIMEIVSKTLYAQMERTKKVVDGIIESEQGYQFTNDKEYLDTRTDVVSDSQGNMPPARGPENPDGRGAPPQNNSKSR